MIVTGRDHRKSLVQTRGRGSREVTYEHKQLQRTHTTETEVLTNGTPIPVMTCAILKRFHKRRLTIINPPS